MALRVVPQSQHPSTGIAGVIMQIRDMPERPIASWGSLHITDLGRTGPPPIGELTKALSVALEATP